MARCSRGPPGQPSSKRRDSRCSARCSSGRPRCGSRATRPGWRWPCCLVAVGAGYAAFRAHHLLFDAATPVVGTGAGLRRDAAAHAGRGDAAPPRAGTRGAAPARARGPHRRRARRRAPHPDGDAAARAAPGRRAARRPRRDDAARPRGRRRPLRLLHARRAAAVLPRRRRRGQGPVGEHLHGGQQGALQEHDAAHRRTGHGRTDDRGQRRSLARQPADAVRHRVRRPARPRHRRPRLLQRGPREPLPDPRGRRRGPAHRRRRRPAAVRGGRTSPTAARTRRCARARRCASSPTA